MTYTLAITNISRAFQEGLEWDQTGLATQCHVFQLQCHGEDSLIISKRGEGTPSVGRMTATILDVRESDYDGLANNHTTCVPYTMYYILFDPLWVFSSHRQQIPRRVVLPRLWLVSLLSSLSGSLFFWNERRIIACRVSGHQKGLALSSPHQALLPLKHWQVLVLALASPTSLHRPAV